MAVFNAETFSRRLKSLREERGMDQRQLAEASGVSLDSVKRYETGRNIPRADALMSMAQALDCSVDILLGAVPLVGVPR